VKTVSSIALVLGLLVSPIACNPFAPDQSVILVVTKLDAPARITAGSSFAVVLTVTTGGCRSFNRIDAVRTTTDVTLTVWGKDAAKGRSDVTCPANTIDETHTFQLNPPFSSTFRVIVNRDRLSPLTATITVE